MPMKPEIKAKWIEALRSGKFDQGKNKLHDIPKNSYCCLGVLCDINRDRFDHISQGNLGWYSFKDEDGSVACIPNAYNLPPEARDYFGLDDDLLDILVVLNDIGIKESVKINANKYNYFLPERKEPKKHNHLTFEEIADFLEQNEGI